VIFFLFVRKFFEMETNERGFFIYYKYHIPHNRKIVKILISYEAKNNAIIIYTKY